MDEYPCIICLQGLPTHELHDFAGAATDSGAVKESISDLKSKAVEIVDDQQSSEVYDGTNDIAQLVPCRHQLHNTCIKMWIEQANSCPTCRSNFNEVEILHTINGDVVSTYHVKNKTQAAEDTVDGADLLDLEDLESFEFDTPCLICDFGGREDELLLCDSCDAPYHASCLGLDGVPVNEWYCPSCVDNHLVTESVRRDATRRRRSARVSRPARRTRPPARLTRRQTRQWDRAWQTVWDRLNNDVEAEQVIEEDQPVARRPRRRRRNNTGNSEAEVQRDADEWLLWSKRLKVAEASGGSSFFRGTAALFFDAPGEPVEETPEMLESWRMLEQALDVEEGPSTSSGGNGMRPRPSRTFANWYSDRPQSTMSEQSEVETTETRKFKRPKSHRRMTESAPVSQATTAESPSLMKSLLHDIRRPLSPTLEGLYPAPLHDGSGTLPTPRSISPPSVSSPTGNHLQYRSPSGSPLLMPSLGSGMPSPPADAKSPLLASTSPGLPNTLSGYFDSSKPANQVPPAPSSPSAVNTGEVGNLQCAPNQSILSFEDKSNIQGIVRDVLRPLYRSGKISKDQYTDINKSVSHILYGLVQKEQRANTGINVVEDLKPRWYDVARSSVTHELDRSRA